MFHKECKRFGLDTQGDVVAALGITRTTLWRVERTQEVQADFIAACLTVFYKARFDDLFEIPAP